MRFLNWYAEHPILGTFILMTLTSMCHGIGRVGSVRNVTKTKVLPPQ